jgi:methanogenic corrinoid protein MtbC1
MSATLTVAMLSVNKLNDLVFQFKFRKPYKTIASGEKWTSKLGEGMLSK